MHAFAMRRFAVRPSESQPPSAAGFGVLYLRMLIGFSFSRFENQPPFGLTRWSNAAKIQQGVKTPEAGKAPPVTAQPLQA